MIRWYWYLTFSLFLLVACTTLPEEQTAVLPTPTAPPSAATIDDFRTQINSALASHSEAELAALMSDPFALGGWRSEWQTLSPSQAATAISQMLPTGTPPKATLVDNAPSPLLDSQNPYAMLGSDTPTTAVYHLTGWGAFGEDEAMLFVGMDENGRFLWQATLHTPGSFTQSDFAIPAPVGLIYRTPENGIWRIAASGQPQQLSTHPSAIPAPDGRHAAYTDAQNNLWLIDLPSGHETPLLQDQLWNGLFDWGNSQTLLLGLWLDAAEGEGPNNGHLTLINIETGEQLLADPNNLSGNRPALAPNGQTVAYDAIPSTAAGQTGHLYNPGGGGELFDPTTFSGYDNVLPGKLFNPAWSPNGRLLAWLASTGDRVGLQLYDLEHNNVSQIFDWDPARMGGMVPAPIWRPDGQWLALEVWANNGDGSGLWLVAANGSQSLLVDPQGNHPQWVNNTELVYTRSQTSGSVQLFNLESNTNNALDLPTGSEIFGTPVTFNMPLPIPVAHTSVQYITALTDVTIHSGPSDQYAILGSLLAGETVGVTGVGREIPWWRVVCPDGSDGDCWITANSDQVSEAQSAAGVLLAHPDVATLTLQETVTPSPNGRWQVTLAASDVLHIGANDEVYLALTVSDGMTTWAPIAEWRNYGMGMLWPQVVQWSKDGRFLYFADTPITDGCVVFPYTSSLYRLYVNDGSVAELLPLGDNTTSAISPNENLLAYLQGYNNTRTLVVREIAVGYDSNNQPSNSVESEAGEWQFPLNITETYAQAGRLIWSADSQQLLLTIAHNACEPGWTHSVLLVNLADLSTTVLLDHDANQPQAMAWAAGGLVEVMDKNGRLWLLNPATGTLQEKD